MGDSSLRAPARASHLVADVDFWRGSPPEPDAARAYKEWQHFIVFGEGWTLLFNLNLDGPGVARAIVSLHGARPFGSVTDCREPELRRGGLAATFGPAGMRWSHGAYEVWHHGEGARFEASLVPASSPSVSHNIALGPGARVSWCLLPRLVARGWIEQGGKRIAFNGRAAYHDHNWGHFAWGGDFAWEWGCAVADDPGDPWTVIIARMCDRARSHATAHSAFLLKGERLVRYFRDAEVKVESAGVITTSPAWRVPSAAALLLPDRDRDVPQRVRFDAGRMDDRLQIEFDARERGQILVPSELDLRRVVRVNEVDARVQVSGRCDGRRVSFAGPGLLEVVRG